MHIISYLKNFLNIEINFLLIFITYLHTSKCYISLSVKKSMIQSQSNTKEIVPFFNSIYSRKRGYLETDLMQMSFARFQNIWKIQFVS